MQPGFDPRPWGTQDLSPIYPNHKFGEKIGEAWLTGDECKVANGPLAGKTLSQLSEQYQRELVGEAARDPKRFPLLLKFLFPHEKLSVTFTAPKPGLFLSAGSRNVGQLAVRQIGSPPELVEETGKGNLRWSEPQEFKAFAAPRKPEGHKGDYGHALIVAGSVGKSGAAVLASWQRCEPGQDW